MKNKPVRVTLSTSVSTELAHEIGLEVLRIGGKKSAALELILARGVGFNPSLYSDVELKTLIVKLNGELVLREQRSAETQE